EYDRVGDPVYAFWFNPISNEPTWGPPRTKIYSAGTIVTKSGNSWPSPSCNWGVDANTVNTSAYAAGGASGSPQLSGITHSIIIGPLSTATSEGGPNRNASSMASILNVRDNPWGETYLIETFLESSHREIKPLIPGVTEATWCEEPLINVAETDANKNLVLDVQEVVDHEITSRDIYTLN